MGKSIIIDLALQAGYFDDIMPDNEYKEYKDKLYKIYDGLCKEMTEKEKYDIIWEIDDAQGGMEASITEQYFAAGFKLGLKIAAQNLID